MRSLIGFCSLALVGCGLTTADPQVSRPSTVAVATPLPPPTAPITKDPPSTGPRVLEGGSDWPVFLGPEGNSISPEKGIIAPWPREGLRVVWQEHVGSGYGPAAVSRGQLFVFDREDDKARLRCLKSTTGEQLWKFDYATEYVDSYGYENGPRCGPIVDGDRVYIFGAEGMLHCVRTEDGKVVWKVDTASKFNVRQNFFGVGSHPVIEGNLLICQVGGSPPGSENIDFGDLKGNNSGIVAFDKHTGEIKYRVTDELASYSTPTLATIGDRRWCFVFARGGLVGMDPATGKVDFRFPWRARILESVNASSPVVVGDKVLITECYGVGSACLQVKPGSCQTVWDDTEKGRNKSLMCHWNTPVHHAGYVYGSSGRHTSEAELRCVELATGKVKWRERGLTISSLLMVDGHFVCLAEYGDLLLLKVNPDKYEEVSVMKSPDRAPPEQTLLRYPCWAAPVLAHGLLYVRGKGKLVCLELIPSKPASR